MAKQKKKDRSFTNSYLKAIQADFGEEKGKNLCESITKRVAELGKLVDDKGNAVVHRHIHDNILPVVACYELLKESGMAPEAALAKASALMHDIFRKQVDSIRKVTKIPFFYKIFKKALPMIIKRNYPPAGWDMRFKQVDNKEISFDCHRCIYFDTTVTLACPELCEAFCKNDDITYVALYPKIKFVRTKTLGAGGDCCDFRMFNGK